MRRVGHPATCHCVACETVVCSACGQEWPRDPALEVACPKCAAKVGHYCRRKRPSGHDATFEKQLIHPERDQLAMDRGFLERCRAAPKLPPALPEQGSLFI